MNIPSFALVLLLAWSTTLSAQVPSQHPDNPLAVFNGSFTVTLPLGSTTSMQSLRSTSMEADNCQTKSTIYVWQTASGRVDYITDAPTINFEGTCDQADGISTEVLFAMLSGAALEQGFVLGYSECPVSCSYPETSRVYAVSCVQRNGSGPKRRSRPAIPGPTVTATTACVANNELPEFTNIPRTGYSCSSPCESTQPE